MKLQQLAVGARFEYEGKVFVKTGPMTASAEVGGQQLIPRYAVLKPLDVADPAPGVAARRLDPARVRRAFETFYAECVAALPAGETTRLEAARAAFLASLK